MSLSLVLHDDVYELAANIVSNGFFPSEPLITVWEEGRMLVVEGNRRLAACKVVISPEAAPAEFQARFKNLAGRFDAGSVKALPILIAPSREAVTPIVIARHTAPQIIQWLPVMRANFYHNLLQGGITAEEVAKQFGLPVGEIMDDLRARSLYQMACRLDLPEEAAAIVRNPREFNLTNLTRIFETPVARRMLGVQFAGDGKVQGEVDPDEFRKAYSRIVTDIAKRTVDSRALNSPSDIQEYLGSLSEAERPDLSKKGAFDSTTFMTQTPVQQPQRAPMPAKRRTPKRPPIGLIPGPVDCNIKSQKVQDLFSELKRLSPGKFPNACAFAFRSFMELSVFCFLDSKGEITTMVAEERSKRSQKGQRLPPHWTPNLESMLRRIADPGRNIIPPGHVTKALQKFIDDEKDLFALNLFVHNLAYHPTETKLRAIWKNLEEFFKLILA